MLFSGICHENPGRQVPRDFLIEKDRVLQQSGNRLKPTIRDQQKQKLIQPPVDSVNMRILEEYLSPCTSRHL